MLFIFNVFLIFDKLSFATTAYTAPVVTQYAAAPAVSTYATNTLSKLAYASPYSAPVVSKVISPGNFILQNSF